MTKEESTPEEEFIDSIKEDLIDVVLKNTIDYGIKKFKQKLPEWREKFQNRKLIEIKLCI